MSKKESDKFIVAALTVSKGKKQDCLIVEEGGIIIATHSQVYGPASRSDCERWVAENCESKASQTGKDVRLQVKINFTDKGEVPPLQAYAFTNQGKLLASAPVEKETATFALPADLDGRTVEVILGPRAEKDQPEPTAAALKRLGAYTRQARVLVSQPLLELNIPSIIFPRWCLCLVRGRLVKRITLPDGTTVERPVCNARVHICEVDRIPIFIDRLPEIEVRRLRDDLLRRLRITPSVPIPPPGPRPGLNRASAASAADATISVQPQPSLLGLSATQQASLATLATIDSVSQLRSSLTDLSHIIRLYLCDLIYLWGYLTMDCGTTVEVDSDGRFHTIIGYNCADQPDLYFWVEQFQDGVWRTVYRPSIGCGTYWNYVCGTEIVLNVPNAVACEEPTYDIPPGVTLFVLPYAIGSTPIWGIPPGAPAAPAGWVRTDGYVDYSTSSLGWLYNAPFGGTLNFIQDDSYFIPSAGIKYYRYSYRRVGDTDWTKITTPLYRGYRMEYSDRLPTYEAYSVGPFPVGPQTGLFEFKPLVPPTRPTDPATVVAREWTSGNLSEVAASWDTTVAAPPLSATNISDDAGDFDVKIEVFNPAGVQVPPGAATFQFLLRNGDGTTTRLATPAELAGGAYVFRVHLDNNGVAADLPQPSIGGVAASDDCGFLRYAKGDLVHIQYLAAHPNNHAVFGFGITRGSNPLASASTLSPYVEVAALSAPTASMPPAPYNKVGANYERNFTPTELVGTCVNAAFAASLNVYGKATNGYQRLGIDTSRLIAFALAELVVVPEPGP